MILTTSSTERPLSPEYAPVSSRTDAASRGSRPDRVSIESATLLRAELDREPEVRPEVVARARALAADPNYPPVEALRKLAGQILGSPDLSEDPS